MEKQKDGERQKNQMERTLTLSLIRTILTGIGVSRMRGKSNSEV
jgi:hypothetical protein